MSDEQDTKESYAMEFLYRDHYVVLIVICFGSLILGVPLSWNMLWHLQVNRYRELPRYHRFGGNFPKYARQPLLP